MDWQKHRYIFRQKANGVKGKAFHGFLWLQHGKSYWELLKHVFISALIALGVSVGILYGLEWANGLLGWALDIKASDFIAIVAAGISVAGVFLALYCSNIAAVFSARYSRAPNEVFDLFMNSFITGAGVRVVLYYIVYSFCFIYHLWKVPETSYLLTGFWGFFTVLIILVFGELGQKSLALTDAFKLLKREYEDIFHSLYLIENGTSLAEGEGIANIRGAVARSLRVMDIMEKNAISSGDFSEASLLVFMCSNVVLVWHYMTIKERIPYDSVWFPQRQVKPEWYELPGYQKKIAVQLGGVAWDQREKNYYFLEQWIHTINGRGIPRLSQNDNWTYRKEYFKFLGNYLAVGAPLSSCSFVADRIYDIQKEWITVWGLTEKSESIIVTTENIGFLYVSYVLGVRKSIEKMDVDAIVSYVSSCKDFRKVDFRKAPFSNVEECRFFLDQINNEMIVTGETLTPDWFIRQYHAKTIFEKLDAIKADACVVEPQRMKQMLDAVYRRNEYVAAAYLLLRMREYHSKCKLLEMEIDQAKIQCRTYCKDEVTYPWMEKKLDYSHQWKVLAGEIAEMRLPILQHLLEDRDKYTWWLQKDTTLLGGLVGMEDEWLIECIAENDFSSFTKAYATYKEIVTSYAWFIVHTIETKDRNPLWVMDQVNRPIINFIAISGYALLWSEAVGDKRWRETVEAAGAPEMDRELLLHFVFWKNDSGRLTDGDEIRFDWRQKMDKAIGRLPVFEEILHRHAFPLLGKAEKRKRNPVLENCIQVMSGRCLIDVDAVDELYPITVLNKAVPAEKQYKSHRRWEVDE
ncbi:hypothetical protein [Dialister succinatiphilus]|uniref:hypothetical protein n=1 Tax=Dialister succinatiphilus TaxID=487173 RepID=UPI0040269BBA